MMYILNNAFSLQKVVNLSDLKHSLLSLLNNLNNRALIYKVSSSCLTLKMITSLFPLQRCVGGELLRGN